MGLGVFGAPDAGASASSVLGETAAIVPGAYALTISFNF